LDDDRAVLPPKLAPQNLSKSLIYKDFRVARLDGATSNELFEVLAEWNDYLEHRKSHDFQVPPCP